MERYGPSCTQLLRYAIIQCSTFFIFDVLHFQRSSKRSNTLTTTLSTILQGTQTIKWLGLAAAARYSALKNRFNEYQPTAVGAPDEQYLFHPKNFIIDHVRENGIVMVEVRGAGDDHPPKNPAWKYLAFENDEPHFGVPTDFTWDQDLSGTSGISVYLKIEGRPDPIQMEKRSDWTNQFLAIVTLMPGTYQYYFIVDGRKETAKNKNFIRASDSKSNLRCNWIEIQHPGVEGIDGFQFIARNKHEAAIVVLGDARPEDSVGGAVRSPGVSSTQASEAPDGAASAEALAVDGETAAEEPFVGEKKRHKKKKKKKEPTDLNGPLPNESDAFVRSILLRDSWLELSHLTDDLFQDQEVREEEIAAMRQLFHINFDFLRNLFTAYAKEEPHTEPYQPGDPMPVALVPTIELRSVWRMMKDCAIPSDTLPLSVLDEILQSTTHSSGASDPHAANCHSVSLEYTFFQWLEGLVKGARRKYMELGAMHAFSEIMTCHLLRFSLESEPADGDRAYIPTSAVQNTIREYEEHLHTLFDSASLADDGLGALIPKGTLSFEAFERIMDQANMTDSKLQKKELKLAFFMSQREEEDVPDPCTEDSLTESMEMVYQEFTEVR